MNALKPMALTFAAAALIAATAAPASAAVVSRNVLKTFFETGNVPTQDQFHSLIDSFLNYNDDGLTITGVITAPSGGTGSPEAKNIPVREFVTLTNLFTVPAAGSVPPMQPEFDGQSGFLGVRLQDAVGGTHYGYFQLSMDSSAITSSPGIHVDSFAFESTPDQGIQVNPIPEPASLTLLTLTTAALLLRRRR